MSTATSLFSPTDDDLLEIVKDWDDSNPAPVLEEYLGITVLRDDLLQYGSKIRFIDYLIRTERDTDEWVYGGGNPYGYGMASLAYVGGYYDKKITCFMAERRQPTEEQQKAIDLGAKMVWVANGRLSVCGFQAKQYQASTPNCAILPMGLWHPTVLASIIKVARSLPILPEEVWIAAGSGTLSRGLQLAWPGARINAVQTGHRLTAEEIGRATIYPSPYKFNQIIKDHQRPPFPSASYYDAKVWPFIVQHATRKPTTLFWNVA